MKPALTPCFWALFAVFLLFQFDRLNAQALNDCKNIGFELGNFIGWQGEYGTTETNFFGALRFRDTKQGFAAQRHTIVRLDMGRDFLVRDEVIPQVSLGNYALRLGNSSAGSQYERIRTSFLVTKDNSLFIYKFAVVMQDPSHKPVQQPKFEVQVLDGRSKQTSCGYYRVAAASNIPGFKNQGDIRYRPWTNAAIDLRDYVGQVVTIQFTTFDCTEGLHYGYAYLDAECISPTIKPSYFCPGLDTTITLNAPDGFATYRWSNGATGRSINLTKPAPGSKYTVQVTPLNSLNENCSFSFEYEIPDRFTRELLDVDEVRFCGSAGQTVKTIDENFQSFKWTFGKNGPQISSTPEVLAKQSGYYYLEARDRSCVFRDSFLARSFPEPSITTDLKAPTCAGLNDGRIALTGANNLGYAWSTGDSGASIVQLGPGTYFATITETGNGCSFEKKFELQAPPAFQTSAKVLKQPCGEEQNGRAEVKIDGGNGPFNIRWSNGETGASIPLTQAGWYKVNVSDSKGCQKVDSIQVFKLELDASSTSPTCFGDKNGEIRLRARGGDPTYWFKVGDSQVLRDSVFKQLAAGKYRISVEDQTGCKISRELTLTDPSRFLINLPKDTSLQLGDSLYIRAQGNRPISTFSWKSSYPNTCATCPEFNLSRITQKGELTLAGKDEKGCLATATMRINVNKSYRIFIPTAFSPNDDKQNDIFEVYPSRAVERVLSLQIFDRWGELLYSFKSDQGQKPRWDGTVRGKKVSPQVLAYKAMLEFIDGEKRAFMGELNLIR
jgi:gliding motility-associated-like protein